MLWVCAANSANSTGVFSLQLNRACTVPRPFLLLPAPTSEGAGGVQGVGKGHSWYSWPKDIPPPVTSCWAYGARGRRGEHSKWWCWPSQEPVTREPCFPGDGWAPACLWEVGNGLHGLLWWLLWLSLYLLNCLYLKTWVFSLLLCWLSSFILKWGEVTEWLCGAAMPAGVKPWLHYKEILLWGQRDKTTQSSTLWLMLWPEPLQTFIIQLLICWVFHYRCIVFSTHLDTAPGIDISPFLTFSGEWGLFYLIK